MKIRPLHNIDLARITTQTREAQITSLKQIRSGRPPFSYNPSRSCWHDIFNVQPELFGHSKPTQWSNIESHLRKKSTSDDEFVANSRIAKSLHSYAIESGIVSCSQDFFPMPMGDGHKISYWLNILLGIDGQPFIPFIDPRRSRGLTSEARKFVFSMMHERIRASARLRISMFRNLSIRPPS